MDRRALFAWMLVAGVVVLSSRFLLGCDAKVGEAGVEAAAAGDWASARRALGSRATSPRPPTANTPKSYVVPSPPPRLGIVKFIVYQQDPCVQHFFYRTFNNVWVGEAGVEAAAAGDWASARRSLGSRATSPRPPTANTPKSYVVPSPPPRLV
ncbi:hypothetical protein TRIUR3_15486 [Triticum urartu]|uniref:Uncharacterized protein n=1 Tax=Triticum urartu TaxID=4572 RepID=M7Z1I0_TRIUA|nr:hypothetical protein TRIUR3_15486 [Triticum urartu]